MEEEEEDLTLFIKDHRTNSMLYYEAGANLGLGRLGSCLGW